MHAATHFPALLGLVAYDGDVGGTALFTSTPCGNAAKQTAPIAADGHVVGADGKLCSHSVQPQTKHSSRSPIQDFIDGHALRRGPSKPSAACFGKPSGTLKTHVDAKPHSRH